MDIIVGYFLIAAERTFQGGCVGTLLFPIFALIPCLPSCPKFQCTKIFSVNPLSIIKVRSTSFVFAPDLTSFISGISWDKEFNVQELQLASTSLIDQKAAERVPVHRQPENEQDELARTAGMLLENIKHEQNPKFQQSQFMGLMKQLRDGEVIVEGHKMVESEGRTPSQIDVKGKGRALDTASRPLMGNFNGSLPLSSILPQNQQATNENQQKVEDPNDAYFRQENVDFVSYWNETQPPLEFTNSAETMAWDKLQADWDNFEATSFGIKAISHYQFQGNNPYLLGESSRTQHHLQHTQGRHSVLEVCTSTVSVISTRADANLFSINNRMSWSSRLLFNEI